jgi:cytochrome P450 family 724 subfamily B polypeptide 1
MVYVLLLVALASLAAAVVLRHFLPLLRNHDLPKGSFGWPLIGETIGFLGAHPSNTTGGFLQDHIARYGTVFKSHLFGAPTVVSCDEELNHFVLHNEERLFQCNYPGPIRTILGESSTLVVTGERHRQLRSMFLSLVASTGLKANYLASLDESARSVVASWRGLDTISFCEEARKVRTTTLITLVKQPAKQSIKVPLPWF